jgi:hypothetical protein
MTIPEFKTPKDPASQELPTLELGQPDRRLTPKEALDSWAKAFGAGVLAPHQMRGYRTVIGWRVTRAIACKKGALHMDQRLADLSNDEWEQPSPEGVPTKANRLNPVISDWGTQDLLAKKAGVALVPRPDTAEQHAALVSRLVDSMWLQRGSKTFPSLGHYGLHGLTHPETILNYWPQKSEILAFEDKVIDQIQGLVMKWSRRRIQAHLREMFDLSLKEIGGLVALATEEARIEASQDIETTRAVMIGRCEDYIDRMREAGDSNNEMKGIKVLCVVQGLNQNNREDTEEALIGVIAKVVTDHANAGPQLRIEAHPLEDEDEERQET